MAAPTYIPGQVLGSADCNNWFTPLAAYKTSDQTIASNATPANDPALFVPLAANAFYSFSCFLFYKGNTAGSGDLKWTWSLPAGAVLRYAVNFNSTGLSGQVAIARVGTDTTTAGTNGTANTLAVDMATGHLTTASTTGNLQLLWSQGTSNATGTTLFTGSSLVLRRIG